MIRICYSNKAVKLRYIILFSILLIIPNTKAQEMNLTEFELYGIGKKLYTEGQFMESINYFSQAIIINPLNSIYFMARGNAYMKLKDYTHAKSDFIEYIYLVPDEPEFYKLVCLCFRYLNNYDSALIYINRALMFEPGNSKYYTEKGNIHNKLKEYDAALFSYTYAISLDSTNGDAYINRGILNYNLKRKEEACADWQKALSNSIIEAHNYLTKYCAFDVTTVHSEKNNAPLIKSDTNNNHIEKY